MNWVNYRCELQYKIKHRMYIPQDEELIEIFYTDAINSAIFGTPVSYLQKYEIIEDYSVIVQTEDALLDLSYELVSKGIEKIAKISEYLSGKGIEARLVPPLSKILANKMADIRQTLIRKQISRGTPTLLDNNWRIINVLSTNWNASTNKFLLNISLTIDCGTNEQQEEHCLQLNVHEAEQFLAKLKQIKKSMKN